MTAALIDAIAQQSNLKVLSLVDAKISEASLQTLGAYVGSTRKITELDISWNTVKPRAYEVLLRSLS